MTRADVSVLLLGSFEVRVEGQPVVVSPGRQRALLAGLALSAGRMLPVDVLAERTWGTELPQDPRGAVQNNVLRLRRALGPDVIRSSADGYLLDIEPDLVDACRFLALIRAAEGADPPRSQELLSDALGLWRGAPLGGVSSDSLERDYAPMLTERYLSAVERRIDFDLAHSANHSELIAELRELTGRYPVRESLWVRLLTVLSRSGRQAEALAAYETVRHLLADTLGADPSGELRRLHHDLLTTDEPTTDGLATHEPARLRTPRQLPPRPVGFVGRARELAELDGLLDRRTEAVAAIHGVGGIGKTTLAVHWAHRRRDAFPDGELYLDLRGYGPGDPVAPETAIGGLLRSLDVPGDRIPTDADQAAALLRTEVAGRRMLLLLDNARDVEQVRPLLPGSDCFVLVTSRSQLRGLSIRDGARRFGLRELTDDEATDLLAASLPADRITAEPAAMAELLQLSGRLPLALRIAAELGSRYPDLTLGQLATELRQRQGSAVCGGRPPAPPFASPARAASPGGPALSFAGDDPLHPRSRLRRKPPPPGSPAWTRWRATIRRPTCVRCSPGRTTR